MKFSGVITIDKIDVHAKVKVKVTGQNPIVKKRVFPQNAKTMS